MPGRLLCHAALPGDTVLTAQLIWIRDSRVLIPIDDPQTLTDHLRSFLFVRMRRQHVQGPTVCDASANISSMRYTHPSEIVPRLSACVPALSEALRCGIDAANEGQPDPGDRDAWYWSHTVRYTARRKLEQVADPSDDWQLIGEIPNSGIHLRIAELHVVRVLRSASGTTPAPGHSRRRREAWQQVQQLQFPFGEERIPPVNLVLDWTTDEADAVVMHLGMPVGVWEHGKHPVLAWRVLIASDDGLEELSFTGADEIDVPVRLRIADAELEAM